MKKIISVSLMIFLTFAIVGDALAVDIEIKTDTHTLSLNQEFWVDVMVDPKGDDINAIQGGIIFPDDILEFKEVRSGDSFISLWVESPHLITPSSERRDMGEVIFSGITPGGFQGMLSPYYRGLRPGKLLSILFKTKKTGSDLIQTNQFKVYLNDGLGSPANTSIKNALVAVQGRFASTTMSVEADKDPPEIFKPEVTRHDDLFTGRWFLIFATSDKGSGIDHFEVSEKAGDADKSLDDLKWRDAQSPYELMDQGLRSFIYVRAIDRAGNIRLATIPPRYPQMSTRGNWLWSILTLIATLALVYGISTVLQRRK